MLKNKILGAALAAVTFVKADQPAVKPHEFSVGILGGYYQYDEFIHKNEGYGKNKRFIDLTGGMIGGSFNYTYTAPQQFVFGVDATFYGGLANYNGRLIADHNEILKVKRIPMIAFEGRLKAGKDFQVNGMTLIPYTGVGIRFKADYSGNIIGTFKDGTPSAGGYDRSSRYLYIPFGLKVKKQINPCWAIETFAEYDLFVNGTQKSYMESGNNKETRKHKQKKGYGLKAGFEGVRKLANGHSISFGPFVNYWHIDDSEGTRVGRNSWAYEPRNKTVETGISLKYRF